MMRSITRRDFLKLAGVIPFGITAPYLLDQIDSQEKPQNVIVIVFDALSAANMPLFGYARETTPNLNRLAERAVVYHNHYAGGNFTTPGTASLLTGTLSWSHRAFKRDGTVDKSFAGRNLFSAFQNHHTLAYTHNLWASTLLNQFEDFIDNYIPLELYLLKRDRLIPTIFGNDADIATVGWNRAVKIKDDRYAYSLYLSHIYEGYDIKREEEYSALKELYPWGIPSNGHYHFLLEQAIDSIGSLLENSKQPFAGYFHFWPPHAPYNTHRRFARFLKDDGYQPTDKPVNPFSFVEDRAYLAGIRNDYDEYILYVDNEFARFFHRLEENGLLDNTWIVFTSDHGEMFERGIEGHITPVLYRPVIHIPLVIFEPGRKNRTDIYSNTSAIDVLPTLMQVTGQRPADWIEGKCLPPYGSVDQSDDRSIYSVEAASNQKGDPLRSVTVTLMKDAYKLMYFSGYEELAGGERTELYDLKSDPEELVDLSATKRETTVELLNELKAKLKEVNTAYE
jgi:arylsulfatase A-like enzyme